MESTTISEILPKPKYKLRSLDELPKEISDIIGVAKNVRIKEKVRKRVWNISKINAADDFLSALLACHSRLCTLKVTDLE